MNANATGAGNGLNWTDAFTDLQEALNYLCAQNLTEIWVAQGTYKPTTGTDRNSSFAMKNGVTLYGGFAGTETALTQRNPTSFTTVLSGDLGPSYDTSDNCYHVINNPPGLTNSAVLDGFVITGSNANGNGIFSGLNGGGMLNNGGSAGNVCSPLIRNCIFQDNVANYGGALYNDGSSGGTSSPSLINCLFLSNFSGLGGALYNNGNGGTSSPVLTNCSFLNNTALLLGQTHELLRAAVTPCWSIAWCGATASPVTAPSITCPGPSSPPAIVCWRPRRRATPLGRALGRPPPRPLWALPMPGLTTAQGPSTRATTRPTLRPMDPPLTWPATPASSPAGASSTWAPTSSRPLPRSTSPCPA